MGSVLSSSHPRPTYIGVNSSGAFQWGRKCGNVAGQETGRGTPVWDPVTFMGGLVLRSRIHVEQGSHNFNGTCQHQSYDAKYEFIEFVDLSF